MSVFLWPRQITLGAALRLPLTPTSRARPWRYARRGVGQCGGVRVCARFGTAVTTGARWVLWVAPGVSESCGVCNKYLQRHGAGYLT